MRSDEGQQRHMAGTLDRRREAALVLGTGASAPPRENLAALGNETLQSFDIFIVRHANAVCTEGTHLTAHNHSAATPTGTTGAGS